VPSLPHEIVVELFRNRVDLARELMRACFGVELPGTSLEEASIDLSQVTPIEYRADYVVIARDEQRAPTGAIIVEIQLSADADKRWTWPAYVAILRAKLRCAVRLLVIAPDDGVARWARERIETGHLGFALEPAVVAFSDVPRVIDPAAAREFPELAVLSAFAHPELDVVLAAAEAIQQLPETAGGVYWDIILSLVSSSVRQLVEARMEGYKYQSEFALRHQAQGREEGREEVRDNLRRSVLKLAGTKLARVPEDLEDRVRRAAEPALVALLVALGESRTHDDALAAIDRLMPERS